MREVRVKVDGKYAQVEGFRKETLNIPWELVKKLESGSLPQRELLSLGHSIFKALFPDRERQNLVIPREGEKVIIVIDSDSQEAHNIPFELMATSTEHPATSFLLKNPNVSLIRTVPTVRLRRETLKRPLKVLFILSQPLEIMESQPIDPLREVGKVKEALRNYIARGLVELEVEVKASPQVLRNRLKRGYDIIHFSGHGREGGYLLLEDDKEPTKPFFASPEVIAALFEESPLPYLVYIDACESSRGSIYSPSLAYRLYKALKGTTVVGNISTITDRGATESVRAFYSRLFSGYPSEMVAAARTLSGFSEWYKTVCFTQPDAKLFEEPESRSREEGIKSFIPAEKSSRHYVYRYDLVRKAADKIAEGDHLFLHGVAGMGKSTLAEYLCEFFEGEFNHVLFIDLLDRGIEEPKELIEFLSLHFDFEEEENPTKSLKNFIKSLKGEKLLLVLDNIDYSVQDKRGEIKEEWKLFVETLLSAPNVFTMFTSRLKILISKRRGLANTIKIGEFRKPDLLLLLQWLDEKKRLFVAQNLKRVSEEIGYYPYGIAYWIEEEVPAEGLKSVLRAKLKEEKEDAVSFYGSYFKEHPELAALVSLPFPVSKDFLAQAYPKLYDLISRLALAEEVEWEGKSFFKFYRALTLFAPEDFSGSSLEELSEKLFQFKNKGEFDYLNLIHLPLSNEKKLLTFREFTKIYGDKAWFALQTASLEAIREIKNISKSLLEPPDYAMALNNLAVLLDDKGEIEEAERLYREALKIYKELSDANKAFLPYYAGTLNNLAVLLKNKGEIEEAERLYREALKIYKELSDANKAFLPDYAMALNNLANLLSNKREIEEAERLYREALKIRKELSDANKAFLPDYAGTLNNLANLLSNKREIEEAERLAEEALRVWESLKGSLLFNLEGWLKNLWNWSAIKVLKGKDLDLNFFERFCQFLTYGNFEPKEKFIITLKAQLSSLPIDERKRVLKSFKSSFLEIRNSLSTVCSLDIEEILKALEESALPKEERL